MRLLVLLFVISVAVAQQNLVVYNGTTGKLADGWLNWSWAKVNLTSTEVVRPGDKYSMSMVCNGWQGAYLSQATPWDLSDYNTFVFWINGGKNPSSVIITVQLTAQNDSASLSVSDYLPNHAFSSNSWVQVEIPISHFALVTTQIKGFWFQANSNDDAVVYFDDVAFSFSKVPPIDGPSLYVNAFGPKTPINPHIYGVTIFWSNNDNNAAYEAFVKEIKLPLNRNGGDGTTRYNWMVDSSNAGFDWFFMGGNGQNTTKPGATIDSFIAQNLNLGVTPTVTIPMIEYINKESPYHCSFPESIYPNQQSYNPYVHPNGENCGNGLSKAGTKIVDTNPLATDVLNTPATQAAWVEHIVATFGNSAKSGVIYQMDNEVSNWAYMHRDVHPNPVTYPEIVNQTIKYASAVKKADPTAMVAAPSEIQFGWYPDWGGTKNVIYFLQQMELYEKQTGVRIVDTYDAHYPDGNNHWPVFTDVDAVRQVIDATYPGTGLSFSEWTMAGTGALGGALAIADELGQFAKNQVAWASLWGLSDTDIVAPVSYGLRIYRNYDGHGSGFGNLYVNSTTGDARTLSIHAALRSADNALTILVINKIANDQKTTIAIHSFSFKSPAQVYQYSSANLNSIVESSVVVGGIGITTTFAAFSLTMIVVTPA